MINKYPILLNEIRFSGISFDKRSFDGVVLYARSSFPLQGDVANGNGMYQNEVDKQIDAYVKENLSQFEQIHTHFMSKIIVSEDSLKTELSKYWTGLGYDKRSFAFCIYPGMLTPSDVTVNNLTACIQANSDEMRKTLHCCFCNEKHDFVDGSQWNNVQPILTNTIASIVSVYDYVPAKRAMIEIKSDIENLMQRADGIREREKSQSIYDNPVLPQNKVNYFYSKVYKPWRQKYDALAEELRLSNIQLVLPHGKIDEEYAIQYLNVLEEEQYDRMITNLKKYQAELEKTFETVLKQTI